MHALVTVFIMGHTQTLTFWLKTTSNPLLTELIHPSAFTVNVHRHKILVKDIIIECSDIDLLQFNLDQKQFLSDAGVVNGLSVSGGGTGTIAYLWREEISLIGLRNGVNQTFFTPDKFINGNFISGDKFHIHVKHNGKDLYESVDYSIGESSGPGTGYDTINIFSITPNSHSLLYATYAIRNI